ncbi:hypothetical protein JJB98_03750 [Bradyrhizobium diazoefficiens]|nr:hypothetical protein [Bradyrhizobium diazoefficiens]QQO19087.1 hypothetical protein JJB98_03750 [Bradyrhizobium diazoefficiens]
MEARQTLLHFADRPSDADIGHDLSRQARIDVEEATDLGLDPEPRRQERLLRAHQDVRLVRLVLDRVFVSFLDRRGLGVGRQAEEDEGVLQEIEVAGRDRPAATLRQHAVAMGPEQDRVAGGEPDRLVEVAERAVTVAFLFPDQRSEAVRVAVVGRELQRALEVHQRLVVPAAAGLQEASAAIGFEILWIARDRGGELGDFPVEIVLGLRVCAA